MISPLYQYIRDFSGDTVPSGAGDANYFELVLISFLSCLNKLLEIYQN